MSKECLKWNIGGQLYLIEVDESGNKLGVGGNRCGGHRVGDASRGVQSLHHGLMITRILLTLILIDLEVLRLQVWVWKM